MTLRIAALGGGGDIGTSSLYAIRECFHQIPVNHENVLGILSLVLWALILVTSVKYILNVMRADNHREGRCGLALMAIAHPSSDRALHGFMDFPNGSRSLEAGLDPVFPREEGEDLTYFVGCESLVSTKKARMIRWRDPLFAVMARTSDR